MSLTDQLKSLRSTIYASFCLRGDANMNTLDALSSFGHHCRSVVELSEAPCFERGYTSITDGIADGLGACQWQSIMKQVLISHAHRVQKMTAVKPGWQSPTLWAQDDPQR